MHQLMPLHPPSMSPLRAAAAPSLTFLRTFTTTNPCHAKSSAKRLAFEHSAVPPYPYGPSKWYKQSNFGLYGLQKIRFGNMVSEKNEIKTRRYWRPNVLRKRLWSPSLQKFLRIRVTARVLRTIDKCGGLDEYLLGDKAARIKELGMGGWKLRWRIMQTEAVKERFRKQREELGLPPREEIALGSDSVAVSKESVAEEIQRYDDELSKDELDVEIGDELDGGAEGGKFMEEKPAKQQDKVVL